MHGLTRSDYRIARGLGWLSVGLGVAQLLAPRTLAAASGLSGRHTMMRACGARELITGAGLLLARNPSPWIWTRVAGDALDLAFLGARAAGGRRHNDRAWMALALVAAITAADLASARRVRRRRRRPMVDYSGRSGFPRPVEEMRGAAADYVAPRDMRIPEPLRPLRRAQEGGADRAESAYATE